MFVKNVLVAVMASTVGLCVVGCMSAESADVATENVTQAAEALTTGVTFDPAFLFVNYYVSSVASADFHYWAGNSSVVLEVPCNATQVGIQANIRYADTGPTLWPRVMAQVPGLPSVTSNLSSITQGTSYNFGQYSNRPANPLSGATSDQTLAVVLTLETYTSSAYTTKAVPDTTATYYVRRMCTCP